METPQELTDDCGEVVWLGYDYAWGGRYTHHYTSQSLNGCAIIESDLQPIRFQGQFYDNETGLHYNRFRYYDSDVGMFISRDPIGLLGGSNVFAYAPNPIHWVDVLGLSKNKDNNPCQVGIDENGYPTKPEILRRFMSNTEYKLFRKKGFVFDPLDSRGGISATTTSIKPKNPDAIKKSTGAFGADKYIDISTDGLDVDLKGKTKGGVLDYKIKSDISEANVVGAGKVKKDHSQGRFDGIR